MWQNLWEILKRENVGKQYKCDYNDSFIYEVKYDSDTNNVIFCNGRGKELFINDVLFKWKYKEIKKDSGWINEVQNKNYTILGNWSVDFIHKSGISKERVESNNCFTTKEKALEVAKEQLLYRSMKKFRDENDQHIDWMNTEHPGYFLVKAIEIGWKVEHRRISREPHTIYFTSRELALKCLKEMERLGLL